MRPLVEIGCGGRRGEDGGLAALGYHVRLQVPGGPCLACNGLDLSRLEDPSSSELKRRTGYVDGDTTVRGELVTLTTRAAADAVELFVRYVTGYTAEVPGHLYYDALRFQYLNLTDAHVSRPTCTLCGEGEDSFRGAGDELRDDQQLLALEEEVAGVAS